MIRSMRFRSEYFLARHRALELAASFGGNERIGAVTACLTTDLVNIITLSVSNSRGQGWVHDVSEALGLMSLARRDHDVERTGFRVDPEVDFG